jgi:transcriptional regulator with XRE-family HTH domain
MHLLDKLLAIQQRHHLSDRAFARKLGLSHDLWSKTRSGKTPIGHKVMRAAAQLFPELKDDLFDYLSLPSRQLSPAPPQSQPQSKETAHHEQV